jgi:hypothetical protein
MDGISQSKTFGCILDATFFYIPSFFAEIISVGEFLAPDFFRGNFGSVTGDRRLGSLGGGLFISLQAF